MISIADARQTRIGVRHAFAEERVRYESPIQETSVRRKARGLAQLTDVGAREGRHRSPAALAAMLQLRRAVLLLGGQDPAEDGWRVRSVRLSPLPPPLPPTPDPSPWPS